MFQFESDRVKSRFVMTLSGDYSHDRDAAHRGLRDAAAEAKTHTRWFDMIVDMTDFSVAPKERAGSGAEVIRWCVASGLRRGAFVTSSAIFRIQLKRLSENSGKFAYFDTREKAEQWIDAQARSRQ